MFVHLEPIYLANALLHMSFETCKTFLFVSKNCQEAMLILKINPVSFSKSPHKIIEFFPNINTMVVDELSFLKQIDTLPDSVTSITLLSSFVEGFPEQAHKYTNRVIEIRSCSFYDAKDYSCFPNLQRLCFADVPGVFHTPHHKLQRLTVDCNSEFGDPIAVFPLDCAEQIVFIFSDPWTFSRAKAKRLPPHVRLVCRELYSGMAVQDFFPSRRSCQTIRLSNTFGVDELRRFIDAFLLILKNASVEFTQQAGNRDLSFMTSLTGLRVEGMVGRSLVLPSTIVYLSLDSDPHDAAAAATERLTTPTAINEGASTMPCPNLRELEWRGGRLCDESVPFPLADATTLCALTVWARCVDPAVRFPNNLTALKLSVDGPFDAATLAPLTRLQSLEISTTNTPLDLSGLVSLKRLQTGNDVSRLPTSLVDCDMCVRSSVDLSPQTKLTALTLTLLADLCVTFPLQLKSLLVITDLGSLQSSNLSELNLQSFSKASGEQEDFWSNSTF